MAKTNQEINQNGRKWARRKLKKDKANNRPHIVGVRLSASEHAELIEQATALGKTKADLLRACWLDAPAQLPTLRLPLRMMNEVDRELYKEWVGIANNLYQLTRISHLSVVAQDKIAAALADLEPALANFRHMGGLFGIEEYQDEALEFVFKP